MSEESEKINICILITGSHWHLKITQHCKSTIFQLNFLINLKTAEWIKKMWSIYTHTYTHTHTEWTVSHKKEWNISICSNMGMSRDNHTKWSKSEESDKCPIISLICRI